MMKKLLALLIVLAPLGAAAQQGTIAYDETVKIEIELPPEMESMRDQIPSTRTTGKILHFTESEGLLKNAPSKEAEEDSGDITMHGDGVHMRFRTSGGEDDQVYTNLDDGVVVDKRDFLGRTFRITGDQPAYAWRLTGEQSQYLGFACQKAVAEQDSTTIEAWFTPEIPVSLGPATYSGLPGMILVVSEDDGRRTYTATDVDLDGVDANEITPPSGGREVTREEYDKIVEEKMKEMGATRGGPGFRIMIRN